ncbi:hypothetical protein PENSPDRAFT_154890 [Peniophora sp. CONT]|nr:hypothetical protein PENSPDRAFT_154890 [Peniophora sp. CONT]
MAAIFGKPADTVDFGGEVNYDGYDWFKEPAPARPPPPSQEPPPPQFIPQQDVIEQNAQLEYACAAMPNVLTQRWKAFGQVGVLGFCSEFEELHEAVKRLGVDGNMFVQTRTAALTACSTILELELLQDVRLQIILLLLSGLIQKLRRFLDPEPIKPYDDYPQINFPIDPYEFR